MRRNNCYVPSNMLFSNVYIREVIKEEIISVSDTLKGDSAYEVAVKLGYNGNEEEWLSEQGATIEQINVTTGEAGTDASVVLNGTPKNRIIDLTIPKGDEGIQGIQGEKGGKGDPGRDGSYVQKAYKTYAGMIADKDNIPIDTSVVVNNDPDKSNNAFYTYDGTEFTKSDFDPQGILTSVDVRLNQAVESASDYFQSQVADTIATSIDSSTVAYTDAIEVTKGLLVADAKLETKEALNTIIENGGLPAKPFATKALMTASVLVDGDYAMVTDDTVNNGFYVKTAGAWVKSSYDPTVSANTYTDNKVKSVTNNFKTKALMAASSLANDSYAMVTEDTEANNGWYSKVSGAWVKSTYDPLAQSKGYTDLQLSKSVGTFDTLELLTASSLVDNAYGTVVNDTEAKNGHYKKTAGVWVKTTYDPYINAVKHTDKETALSKDATANLLRGLQASDLSIINLDDENTRTLATFKVQADINTSANRAIQGVSQTATILDKEISLSKDSTANLLRGFQGNNLAIKNLDDENTRTVDTLKAQTDWNTSTNRSIQGVSQVVATLDNISNDSKFSNLYHKSRELVELAKLDGFDTEDSDVSAKPFIDNTYVFGEPRGLIRIDMTMPYVPTSKDDGDIEGTVKVNVDGEILSSHAIFSVQGASSAGFRKKNLNVEFCTDDTYDTDVFLKIGDIRPHAKWVYKANFIDHSQARNLTGYRLWKQMQDLRTGYPAKDIDNYYVGKTGVDAINTQASGHPDGATCVAYVNGQFYGLGTFLIGKRNENYNLDKANPNHIGFNFAPGDDQDNTIRLLMNELEEGTFELRHPKKYTPLVTQRFAEFAAVNDLPQAEFDVAIRNVLDTRNVVDFYLHNNMLGNWDAQINNTQCVTWDGVRWYFFPYDLDQIFVKGTAIGDIMKKSQNGFYWIKVYKAYETEIKARYAELRKTIFTLKSFDDLFKRITLGIPLEFYLAEQAKWGGELVSHTEYMEWVRGRLANLDTIFNYTEVN